MLLTGGGLLLRRFNICGSLDLGMRSEAADFCDSAVPLSRLRQACVIRQPRVGKNPRHPRRKRRAILKIPLTQIAGTTRYTLLASPPTKPGHKTRCRVWSPAITFPRSARAAAEADSSTSPTGSRNRPWRLSMNPLPIATFPDSHRLARDFSSDVGAQRHTGIRSLAW